MLGLSPVTLAEWERSWQRDRLACAPRGRPTHCSGDDLRSGVQEVIEQHGPGVGVPTLQGLFPAMPRGEIRDILHRHRTAYILENMVAIRVLTWRNPGAVWAMDFVEPPQPVDGDLGAILAVRDMASGYQLLWMALPDQSARVTIDALTLLFLRHGPPLVLKSDNGSAFIADATTDFLTERRVVPLLSPPALPQYNGSVEAGNGSMQTRTHLAAARNDRPGEWTADDLEAARLQANRTARPWGWRGPTPEEVWTVRTPIVDDRRRQFVESVNLQEAIARQRNQPPGRTLDQNTPAALNRVAIGRALVGHGLLEYRRRLIAPPIVRRKMIKI
jgi:transposase InsO family protein